MSRYFGDPWPSGICDDGLQVDTPIGVRCGLCEEAVVDGDQGEFWADGKPVHRECGFRAVMGGIEHLKAPEGHALGSCYAGSTLTYRQSALQAWDWWQQPNHMSRGEL